MRIILNQRGSIFWSNILTEGEKSEARYGKSAWDMSRSCKNIQEVCKNKSLVFFLFYFVLCKHHFRSWNTSPNSIYYYGWKNCAQQIILYARGNVCIENTFIFFNFLELNNTVWRWKPCLIIISSWKKSGRRIKLERFMTEEKRRK